MTMKIDEAIKILEEMLKPISPYWIQDYVDATKLGLEALKLIQRERLLGINPIETQLPGETKE